MRITNPRLGRALGLMLLLAAAATAQGNGRGGGGGGGGGGGDDPPPPAADPAIAFLSDGVYVMNADGTNVTSLGISTNWGLRPTWSPDLDGDPSNGYQGTLAFTRLLEQPYWHFGIWLVDVAVVGGVPQGLNLRQVWDPGLREALWMPAWSPDLDPVTPGFQGRLAYVDFEEYPNVLMLLDIAWNGDPIAPSTVHAAQDLALVESGGSNLSHPTWSSDGHRIAYTTNPGSGSWGDLMVIDDLQDPQPRALAPGVEAAHLDWSRTGDVLAFRVYVFDGRRDHYSLWTLDVDDPVGTLAPLGVEGHLPSWSPDGSAIIFSDFTGKGGYSEIWKLDLATAGLTVLASKKRRSYGNPSWRPF